MRRCLLVSFALWAMLSAPAMAQACLGLASYSENPFQVTGSGWLASQTSSLGATLGYGRPTSVFGSLAVGSTSDEAVNGSNLELGATVGYQIPVAQTMRAQVCPVASVGVGIGPKNTFDSGVDRSSRTALVGVAFATTFLAGPRLTLIPMLGLGYAHRQDKAEDRSGVSLFEISRDYARVQVGIGMVLNDHISIRPSADFQLGLGVNEPAIGLTLGYNFGSSRRSRR